MLAFFKANVISLSLGDDWQFDSSGVFLLGKSQIGPDLALRGTPTPLIKATALGRAGVFNSTLSNSNTTFGTTAIGVPLSVWGLFAPNALPHTESYGTVCRGNPHVNDSAWVCNDATGTSNLYNGYGTKYRDNSATIAMSTTPSVYRSDNPSNTDSGIACCGYGVGLGPGGGAAGIHLGEMCLSIIPSAGQAAEATAVLLRYLNRQ